jgi:hypothetical protein
LLPYFSTRHHIINGLIFAYNRAIFVFPVKVVKGNNKPQVVIENLTDLTGSDLNQLSKNSLLRRFGHEKN